VQSLIVSKTRLDNLDMQKQFAEAKGEPPIISRNVKALLEELAGREKPIAYLPNVISYCV
jgi:hypothetical protein